MFNLESLIETCIQVRLVTGLMETMDNQFLDASFSNPKLFVYEDIFSYKTLSVEEINYFQHNPDFQLP